MIKPFDIHAGHYDCDDATAAAKALKQAAIAAEPSVTPVVKAVANTTGGSTERLNSRFKTQASIMEKLERFAKPRSPRYQLDRFNDALRYTIVYPEAIYWQAIANAHTELNAQGFIWGIEGGGWKPDGRYKGLNVTMHTASGYKFEIQFHTQRSLDAAERTHAAYEEKRQLPPYSPRAIEIQASCAQTWANVPVPPRSSGVREKQAHLHARATNDKRCGHGYDQSMEYYKFSAGLGRFDYVRIDVTARRAWLFDDDLQWIEHDAYFDEIWMNGGGQEITEAEALSAIELLRSALATH